MIIDCAFTKLFYNTSASGSSRLWINCACYLAADFEKDVRVKETPKAVITLLERKSEILEAAGQQVRHAFEDRKKATTAKEQEAAEQRIRSSKKSFTKSREDFQDTIQGVSTSMNTTNQIVVQKMKSHLSTRNQQRAFQWLRASQSLDVVFVLDATDSMAMQSVFDAVRVTVRSMVKLIQDANKQMSFRIGGVAFRDVENGEQRYDIHPMKGSISQFEKWLSQLKLLRNGDVCEDSLGGIGMAADMEWKNMNKLMFLCTDAPCHGREFNDGAQDNYPDRKFPGSRDPVLLMKTFAEKNIQVKFLKVNSNTDVMITKLNKIALDSLKIEEFVETMQIDMADGSSIVSSIKASIVGSLQRSFVSSATVTGNQKQSVTRSTIEKMGTLAGVPEADETTEVEGETKS